MAQLLSDGVEALVAVRDIDETYQRQELGLGWQVHRHRDSGRWGVVFPSEHEGFLGGEYGQTSDPEAFAAELHEVLGT